MIKFTSSPYCSNTWKRAGPIKPKSGLLPCNGVAGSGLLYVHLNMHKRKSILQSHKQTFEKIAVILAKMETSSFFCLN